MATVDVKGLMSERLSRSLFVCLISMPRSIGLACSPISSAYTCDVGVVARSVPAEIAEDLSSSDVTVQEGDSVWLHCNVTGVPPPAVTWHRRTTSGRDTRDCRQRTVDAGITDAKNTFSHFLTFLFSTAFLLKTFIENPSKTSDRTFEATETNQ